MSDKTIAVWYHNDADGFGAAYACWKKFGERAEYVPVQYGQPVPGFSDAVERIYIVDFSYDRGTLQELREICEVIVIDHHKTAAAELDGLQDVVFNMSKSGAVLTWEYFFPGAPVPRILEYVQDRDLWRFQLNASKEINLYIHTIPQTFRTWDSFEFAPALACGYSMQWLQDAQVERAAKAAVMVDFAGHNVPMLNCTQNVSEVGNYLCEYYEDAPFSVTYADRKDGKRSYSLRSIGEFDVSAIAKQFGGGGHRNAAGFSVPMPDLLEGLRG